MKDCEKLFIVMYVNVRNIDMEDVPEYLHEVKNALYYDETVNTIVVPIRDGDTRIECINPALLTDDKYKEVERVFDECKKRAGEFLKTE